MTKMSIMSGVPLKFYKKEKKTIDMDKVLTIDIEKVYDKITSIPHIFSMKLKNQDEKMLVKNISEVFDNNDKKEILLRDMNFEKKNKKRKDILVELSNIEKFSYDGEVYIVIGDLSSEFSSVNKLKKHIIN